MTRQNSVTFHESILSRKNPAFEFLLHILPRYRKIENTFEKGFCYHGRSHIIRVWLFAAAMSNYLLEHGIFHDQFTLLCAAAGHDVGRLGSGEDIWEEISAEITVKTMRDVFQDNRLIKYSKSLVRECIIRARESGIEAMILRSADSLDIARLMEFKVDMLPFLKGDNYGIENSETIRLQLVKESKILIKKTYPHAALFFRNNMACQENLILHLTKEAMLAIYRENTLKSYKLIRNITSVINNKNLVFLKKYACRGETE